MLVFPSDLYAPPEITEELQKLLGEVEHLNFEVRQTVQAVRRTASPTPRSTDLPARPAVLSGRFRLACVVDARWLGWSSWL